MSNRSWNEFFICPVRAVARFLVRGTLSPLRGEEAVARALHEKTAMLDPSCGGVSLIFRKCRNFIALHMGAPLTCRRLNFQYFVVSCHANCSAQVIP